MAEKLTWLCGRNKSVEAAAECKTPARLPRRARFQLWIFSYTREGVIVKKMAVKIQDWAGPKKIASVWKIQMGDLFASISNLACTGLPACAGNRLDGGQHAVRRLPPAPFGTPPTR
jgi:hypothetical protein